MAELWITSRLILIIFSGIFCQLFSASATVRVLNDVTWDTAFHTCHQHGEQLYSTSDITSLSVVTAGSYWIGAKVQYKSWMWTADNTPLFDYIGEVNESQSVQFYQIKYENQASRCYYECQPKNIRDVTYIGLQREKCYCFNSRSWNQISHGSVQRQNKTGCRGNPDENCGTENTMSIYKTDFTINLGIYGLCGFVETDPNILILKADENCDSKKGHICSCPGRYSNKSCYNHHMNESWFSSNSSCVLAKPNTSNAETIRQKLWGNGVQYWIGIKRDKQRLWTDSYLNNQIVNKKETENDCVLLQKFQNGSFSFSFSNCDTRHSAVCLNNSSFTTSNLPSSETYKTSPGAGVTKSHILNEDEKDQTGVAVGVSITLILLVVGAVVVTVWMKRSHKFCFKTKPESSNTRQIRSVNQQNLSDYDEIKPATDSNYEFETLTNVTMVTKLNSSNYELTTDVNAANVQTNSSDYELANDVNTGNVKTNSSDYELANDVNTGNVKTNSSDYELATDVNTANVQTICNYELATDVNAAAAQTNNSYNNTIDEDDYNVLNDSHIHKNVDYNHTDSNVEGDYDTADSKPKSMSTHDKTYNHIGDVMEGDYDTTTPKSTSSHDDTYNHVAAVTEDDYNIADMDLRNVDYASDDYNHLGSVRG